MKLKGIVRGQAIEILEEMLLPEGAEVTIDIKTANDDDAIRLAKIQKLFGCWQDQPDLIAAFEQSDFRGKQG
jgi:hypothetical protein